MRHLLTAGHRGAAGTGLETLKHGTVLDDGALHGEAVSGEIVVVLGVRDGALERLRDQLRALARDEHQIVDCVRGLAALDRAGDFADLLRGHPRVASEGLDFHVGGEDSGRRAARRQ